jgi:hypothetical protein
VAGAGGLAAHAALEEPALGLFGTAGAALMALALALGRGGLIAPALVLVAAGYTGALVARDADALDATAPLVGCSLLVVAELAHWSVELVGKGREERSVLLRRLGAMLGLAGGALGLGAAVLAVTALPLGGGLAWNLVGVAAAAGALALIARLAASPER